MNETRYGVTISGDPPLLKRYAFPLEALSKVNERNDPFDPGPRIVLPRALAGFERVGVRSASMSDERLRVFYICDERYTVAPLAILSRAHPQLTISVTASREYEWEVSFRTGFSAGRQSKRWEMVRNPVRCGPMNTAIKLLSPEREVGAIVTYHDYLLGKDGAGQIVAISPEDGELEIMPLGALDSTSLSCLRNYGRPIDEPDVANS